MSEDLRKQKGYIIIYTESELYNGSENLDIIPTEIKLREKSPILLLTLP
jgi:hypothetical protein